MKCASFLLSLHHLWSKMNINFKGSLKARCACHESVPVDGGAQALFTPNGLLIYEAIPANPERVIHMATSALAEVCGVSQPALSRFIKNLGYSRYQDFRAEWISAWPRKTKKMPRVPGVSDISILCTRG